MNTYSSDLNDGPSRMEVALSDAANALQAATLLVTLQRQQRGDSPDVIKLEAALARAMAAVRRLQRDGGWPAPSSRGADSAG